MFNGAGNRIAIGQGGLFFVGVYITLIADDADRCQNTNNGNDNKQLNKREDLSTLLSLTKHHTHNVQQILNQTHSRQMQE